MEPAKRLALALLNGALRAEGAALRPFARHRARRLASGDLRLHCGCGFAILPGWVNIDLRSSAYHVLGGVGRPQLYANLERGIPFPDASATHVYSNNFVEHLDRDDAIRHIADTMRVLRPGGRVRIVVPDAAAWARAYVDGDQAFFARVAASTDYWPKWCREPMDFVMTMAHGAPELGWTHRWGWDEQALTAQLRAAGFVDVARMQLNESADEHLRGIDGRLDAALVVEGVKPAS